MRPKRKVVVCGNSTQYTLSLTLSTDETLLLCFDSARKQTKLKEQRKRKKRKEEKKERKKDRSSYDDVEKDRSFARRVRKSLAVEVFVEAGSSKSSTSTV